MAEHNSQAIIGWGTKLQRGGLLSTDAYTDVHELIGFDAPNTQGDKIEVSHFESPGLMKEKIRGMIDNGQAKVELNWRPDVYAEQASFRSDKADGLVRYYRFILPGAMETITMRAYVSGFQRKVNPNQAITVEVTFEVSTVIES